VRAGAIAGALLCAGLPASALGSSPGSERGLTTHVNHTRVLQGRTVTIAGQLKNAAGPVAHELLELQVSTRARGGFQNIAHVFTVADGDYRFPPLRLYAETRVRVADEGNRGRTGRTIEVSVELPDFPTANDVAAASRYIGGRAGFHAFAEVDDQGRLFGVNVHSRFHSASVVKSMLLVAYLRMLSYQHRSLDGESQGLLYPMIHSSDNASASAVLGIVGEQALEQVARDAGMQDYQSGGATWGFTEVSAADLARFFYRQDDLIPRQFDGYARWLLSNIEPSESWGIPAVARPEFQVFFKGGWLPEVEGLVNQVGRLERPRITFSLAVLTTHDPSMAYGEETIEGVTARLIGR
jgi:hypothetical protein